MSDETFEGFVPPTKNYFPMPNEWIDICAEITSCAELKVIQYVLRHTWGYREFGICKTISVDEFQHGRKRQDGSRMDKGTGLSNHSVIDGLRAAEKHGYLICEVDNSDLARTKKSYALKMASRGEESSPPAKSSPPEESSPGEESTASYEESSQPGEESSPRSEKDTTRNTPKKDTVEKQESTPASLSEYKHRKETDPALPVVKPSKQKPIDPSPSPAADKQSPSATGLSSSSPVACQAASGQDMPAMALTAKDIKKQNEKRAKDIWIIIERELKTKFTRTQRTSDYNTKGMENLIEDEVSDETLTTALKKLPAFYIPQFNLKKFHEMIPGLTSTRDAPQQGTPKQDVIIRPAGTVRSFNGIAKRAAGQ